MLQRNKVKRELANSDLAQDSLIFENLLAYQCPSRRKKDVVFELLPWDFGIVLDLIYACRVSAS